jgi:hypothetical protein
MRLLSFICCVFTFVLSAQDSIKPKFKLYDLTLFMGPEGYPLENIDLNYVSRFTQNKNLLDESQGYQKSFYQLYEGSDGILYGMGLSFKTNSTHPFFKRIKPRISLIYSDRIFFRYNMNFRNKTTIDTLYFTDPDVSPILIDSTYKGEINYTYQSQTLFFEIGCNVDIVSFNHFNFYAGLSVGEGFSYKNELAFEKKETYSITNYPEPKADISGTVKNIHVRENSSNSYCTRIMGTFGVLHRFGKRRNFSPGIFVEALPGYQFYKVSKGTQVNGRFIVVKLGIRLSFQKHK